jgi:hypothetical protein
VRKEGRIEKEARKRNLKREKERKWGNKQEGVCVLVYTPIFRYFTPSCHNVRRLLFLMELWVKNVTSTWVRFSKFMRGGGNGV